MNEQLSALGDRFWDLAMSNSPMWASIIGDHRFDADVEDLSLDHEDEAIGQFESIVTEATTIDPASHHFGGSVARF